MIDKIKLRKFQSEMIELGNNILAGYLPGLEVIVADITCGGGKSSIPPILHSILRQTGLEYLGWMAPRRALLGQGEDAYNDLLFRKVLGHNLKIRQTTNEDDPIADANGFIETYQALGKNPKPTLKWCEAHRGKYLLFLDEAQSVYEKCAVEPHILQMHFNAGLTVAASGTFQRHDKKRVSILPYVGLTEEGKWQLDTRKYRREEPEYTNVTYSRRDALKDHAILKSEVYFQDAQGKFRRKGEDVDFKSLRTASKEDVHAALRSAVETEYANQMMDAATDNWLWWRKNHQRSQIMYTAFDQPCAREYVEYVKKRHGIPERRIGIAISDETDSLKVIEAYKRGDIWAIVTVAMAYIGLDVRAMTHLCNLSVIRSYPWQAQLLARPGRVDDEDKAGTYEEQRAFIWMPDDFLAHKCVDDILADQAAIAQDPQDGGGGGGGGDWTYSVSSNHTTTTAQELSEGEVLDEDRTETTGTIQRKVVDAGGPVVPLFVIDAILQAHDDYEPPQKEDSANRPIRESEREKSHRAEVDAYVKDYVNSVTPYYPGNKEWVALKVRIDVELKRLFGKGKERTEWRVEQCTQAMKYLHEHYPMTGPTYAQA